MNKLLAFLLLLCAYGAIAQSEDTVRTYGIEKTTMDLWEDELGMMGQVVLNGRSDSLKRYHNEVMRAGFREMLKQKESFRYRFDRLTTVSKLMAPDEKFRIYTWMLPLENGLHEFYGFIQIPGEEEFRVVELFDNHQGMENRDFALGDADNWFGCLYYEIRKERYKGEVLYTLLGWNGKDPFSNMKIFEILTFDIADRPRFGKPIIHVDSNPRTRFILEYGEDAGVSFRWNRKLGMYVFDHLVPKEGAQPGMYAFYIPDFSYDAIEFRDGEFWLVEDVEVNNR
ncbi:hypothetical protein HZ996_07920 [Cryomorphaceae bacterium]|nr:hypothetical protein HZ996_07920 [Cryomorphaceae bacterium]